MPERHRDEEPRAILSQMVSFFMFGVVTGALVPSVQLHCCLHLLMTHGEDACWKTCRPHALGVLVGIGCSQLLEITDPLRSSPNSA